MATRRDRAAAAAFQAAPQPLVLCSSASNTCARPLSLSSRAGHSRSGAPSDRGAGNHRRRGIQQQWPLLPKNLPRVHFPPPVLGELTTRSINFLISKITKPWTEDVEDRLQRVLLRAQVISDEAIGRHITNHAMLLQLDMLRDAIHRGYYTLDSFRYESHDEETKHQIAGNSLSLSKISSVNGPYFFGMGARVPKQLHEALDRLSSMIVDMDELVRFLTSYPCLYRQPYSMHILLSNCMFGRHLESEFVVNFLLHIQPHGPELEVLPIVGPGKVGKSTLVAHVCKDERVSSHFSEIMFLGDHDFSDVEVATLKEGCARKHKSHLSDLKRDGRLLLVAELVGDVDDNVWNRLYSASKDCVPNGSKMIVTSRSDNIVKFGTRQALTLKHLSLEAYWYFFKTITFGSTDPEKHPKLAHLAFEISGTMNRALIGANIAAHNLRNNFEIRFWYKLLTFLRGYIPKYVSKFAEHPFDVMNNNRATYLGRMGTTYEAIMVSHYKCSLGEDVPKIMLQDVLFGSVSPHGKFEALAWKSNIAPYYNYIYTCEIREMKPAAVKRKRPFS